MTEEPKKENETQRKMQQLLARAMKDEAWRQELLTNPKTLIERELGISLPQGVTIATHEDTSTTVHLVLPPRQLQAVEVSDADLEGDFFFRSAGVYATECATACGTCHLPGACTANC